MTVWEQRYQTSDTPWEKGAPHPALRGWMQTNPLEGRILVPGCGSGHDVRALADAGAEVVGLDLAPSAIAAADRFPKVGKESYVQGDLFALPPSWAAGFDGVFEHTCFCAIPPEKRPDYLAAVTRILKPGGRFLAVFFFDPDSEDGGPPFGCTREEVVGLFASGFDLVSETKKFPTYPGREGRERCMEFRRKQAPSPLGSGIG